MSFSNKEFKSIVHKCNNLSTPGPDQISQKHLKAVVKDEKCLNNIVNIANQLTSKSHSLLSF